MKHGKVKKKIQPPKASKKSLERLSSLERLLKENAKALKPRKA